MTVSHTGARKAILALISDCWQAKSGDIVGGAPPELRIQGVQIPDPPDSKSFWARASTQGVTTRQRAHSVPPEHGGPSKTVYATYGIVFVEVFAPMCNPMGWETGELLSELAQGMFMQSETGNGVWFRNPRIVELPSDDKWYRWHAIADYTFNQVKGA